MVYLPPESKGANRLSPEQQEVLLGLWRNRNVSIRQIMRQVGVADHRTLKIYAMKLADLNPIEGTQNA